MISKMFEFFVLLNVLFFCTVLQYFFKNMHNCDAVYLNVIFNGPIWVSSEGEWTDFNVSRLQLCLFYC